MIRATVSGSFHRHMQAIYEAVGDLRSAEVEVLSPSDPRVVDAHGDFLFVASDVLRSIELVQRRHFEAIRHSDFLLVVSPDGYTGESTSGEIGAAIVLGVPVLATRPILNTTWRAFIHVVAGIPEAVRTVRQRRGYAAQEMSFHMPSLSCVNVHLVQSRLRQAVNPARPRKD